MKKIIIGLVILLAVGGGLLLCVLSLRAVRSRQELATLRNCVEKHYAEPIAAVEQYMVSCTNMVAIAHLERRVTLEHTLAAPEIYSASCSFDGHHGLDTLKMLRNRVGVTHYTKPASQDESGVHRLYRGVAMDGTQLVVYHGWLESAPVYRDYTIALCVKTLKTVNAESVWE